MNVGGFNKAAGDLLDQLTDLAGNCCYHRSSPQQWGCQPGSETGAAQDGTVWLLHREHERQLRWSGGPCRCPTLRVDEVGSLGEFEPGSAPQSGPESR
jgi:hypothetical protein